MDPGRGHVEVVFAEDADLDSIPDLSTVDLIGVDVIAAGGPYFGQGSPAGGDYYTEDDLSAIAANCHLFADEVRAPNKLGHSTAQALLRNSGLVPDGDEVPAAGWIDLSSLRVEAGKLLADIRRVPKKVAQLIKAGAFRTRSVELKKMKGQKVEGEGWVVTGLAWLGAVAPAMRTLDDVVALYADQEAETPPDGETSRFVDYGEGDVAWRSDEGSRHRSMLVERALNPGPPSMENPPRFWVMDIRDDAALVEEYNSSEDAAGRTAWIVPYTLGDDGMAQIADRAEWTLAREAWVETSRQMALRDFEHLRESSSRESGDPGNTRPQMEFTLTDERAAELRQRFSLPEDAGADELLRAMNEALDETPNPDGGTEGTEGGGDPPTPAPSPPAGEEREMRAIPADEYARLISQASAGASAAERLFAQDRTSAIETAIREFRLDPADREEWTTRYTENPTWTTAVLGNLPVREDLRREFGDEGNGLENADGEEALFTAYAEATGVRLREVRSA